MNYGLQMWTIHEISDIEYALTQAAEIGYKSVELCGNGGKTPEQLREILDRLGLTCIGTHGGMESFEADFDAAAKEYETLGCKNVVVPWADFSTEERLVRFANRVNALLPRMREAGFDLHFHNHAGEFKVNADGSTAHQFLVDNTDISFEVDTFWAYVAKTDPCALLERLKNRISIIHLKDGDSIGNGLSLGIGNAPVCAVRKKAIELGINIVVESESFKVDCLLDARACMDYLRTLDALD